MPRVGAWLASDWLCGAESKTAAPASRASPLLQGVCEVECLLWEPGLPAIGCTGAESKTASPASRASPLLQGVCEAECLVWEPGLPAIGCAGLRVKPRRLHRGHAFGPLTGQATNGLISLSTNMLCISLIPVRRRITDMAKSAKVSRSRETTCNRKSASPPML